jgi:hypothetical protein
MSSWNFKDNLTIDNGKYLKWLDPTGLTRNNIIGLDTNSNVNINSGISGDLYLNCNNSGSTTYINTGNTKNVLVASNLGVGVSTTTNMNATLTLPVNGWVGVNSTSNGYLGLSSSDLLSSSQGAILLIYGNNNTSGNAGKFNMYTGSNTNGSFNFYTGNNSNNVFQISNGDGSVNFSPDGNTSILTVSKTNVVTTAPLILTNTTQSTSPQTGALQIAGGVGIAGDTFIDGLLSINSITGNLNFNNTKVSTSYSTGTFFLSGGLGIECSTSASSPTAGGAISIAGGLALGKNAMLGGNITIFDTTASISSQTGSVIAYGGAGINGQVNIKSNSSSQLRIAPLSNSGESSIYFSNKNNYSTIGSWSIGNNLSGFSNGFSIIGANNGVNLFLTDTQTQFYQYTKFLNEIFFQQNSSSNFITFTNSSGTTNWKIGSDLTTGNFQITNNALNSYNLTINSTTGEISLTGTENATSPTHGGSLTIAGGAAVANDLYVGGQLFAQGDFQVTGTLQGSSSSVSQFAYLTLTATDLSENITSGALVTFGGITIQSTGDATSFTNGGSLLTSGGGAIGLSLYVGTELVVGNLVTAPNLQITNASIANQSILNSQITNNSVSNSVLANISSSNTVAITTSSANLLFTKATGGQLLMTNVSTNSMNVSGITASNLLVTSLISSSNLFSTNSTTSNAVISNLSSGTIQASNGITSGTIYVTGPSNLSFNSNTVGNIFTTGGNVGINTKTPSFPLHVNGSQYIPSNYYLSVGTQNQDSTLNIKDIGNQLVSFYFSSTKVGGINTYNGDSTLFLFAGASKLTLSSIGNVGISTTTPMYNLDVLGGIRGQSLVSVSDTDNNISSTTGSFNFSSDIVLSNSTRNSIVFGSSGVSPPSLATRSPGTKLLLYPQIGSSSSDYAVGIEFNNLWYSVPTTTQGFKWYQGATNVMSISNHLRLYTTMQSTNSTTGGLVTLGGISIANTGNASSVTSGYALSVAGGASFAKDIYIGGTILQANTATGTISNLLISSTSSSSGVGSGGSFTVLGGVAISKNLYVGTQIAIGNTTTISPQQMLEISPITYSSSQDGGLRISTKDPVSTSDTSYRYIDIRLKSDVSNNFRGAVVGTLGGGSSTEQEYMNFSQDGYTYITSQANFTNNTSCSNSSTASVVVSGGLSINAGTNAINVSNGGALTVYGGASISGDLIVGGAITYANAAEASSTFAYLTLTASDQSTDVGNGALVTFGGISIQTTFDATSATSGNGLTVAGGAGIGASLYVGTITKTPNLLSTNISTTNLVVTNEKITNLTGTNVVITNELKATYNSNTLGNLFTTNGNVGIGTTSPSTTLSIVNDGFPNLDIGGINSKLRFIGGSSDGYAYIQAGSNTTQGSLRVGQYNASTSNMDTIEIYSNTTIISGVIKLTNTINSSNSTTGNIVSSGGISISKTTNATSVTSGGALTIAGGMSVLKDVYVGGTITSSSDKNLKKNIKHLPSILDKIINIHPISYNSLNESDTTNYIGFIAQDFIEHFPDLLRRENKDAYYSLAYDRITALNFKCIKELVDEVNSLKCIIKSFIDQKSEK